MTKTEIKIFRGDEYRSRVRIVGENEYGRKEIDKAKQVIDEIREDLRSVRQFEERKLQDKKYAFSSKNVPSVGNNIALISGERGQGKTSTLLTLINEILEAEEGKDNRQYVVMDVIDPSRLADGESLVRIITAKIYDNTKEYIDRQYERMRDDKVLSSSATRMSEYFRDIFERTGTLQNKGQFEYYDDLQTMAKLASSSKICVSVKELVDEYLSVCGCNHQQGTLIVPIDDLDLCIQDVFDLCEEIRQHLATSNIIVLLAANYRQIQYAVEQTYLKKYQTLLQFGNSEQIANKCTGMTGKYLEKLFPVGHRIEMTDIHSLGRSELENIYVHIEAMSGDSDSASVLSEVDFGLQMQLLRAIYERTGIFLLEGREGMNPLLPRTLRELTHYIKFMTEELREVRENEEGRRKEDILYNITLFKRFFLNYWCRNYLSLEQQELLIQIDDAGGDIGVACDYGIVQK